MMVFCTVTADVGGCCVCVAVINDSEADSSSAPSSPSIAVSLCPENYWNEPSKRCYAPLIAVLDKLQPAADSLVTWSLTRPRDIERTCQ